MNYTEKLLDTLSVVMGVYPDNQKFSVMYIEALTRDGQWLEVLNQASKYEQDMQTEIIYSVTLARYRLGLIKEAYDNSITPTTKDGYAYWDLIGELAFLEDDLILSKYCYKMIIALFPEYKDQALQRLSML